ncbi:hypothetical protein ACTWJ9_33105 (plasmid) [Streptomyces sp. GDS52]|uniref:hypothetical protein n=1 Tax=Streptomyces sp. GDS52 TaxID=3406419 RepID=UPI003FD44A43
MRIRTTTAAATAVLALTLTACGSSSSGDAKPAPATATATPTTAPSLSQAETARRCSEAVAEAAPGWDNWSYSPGKWQDDPRTPEVCQGLADEDNPARGNRAFAGALIDGLEMADDPRARQ